MEKTKANDEFNTLNKQEQQILLNIIYDLYNRYTVGKVINVVDVPYFVHSVLKNDFDNIFSKEEIEEYLKIEEVWEFSIQTVYVLSKIIKNRRK